MQEILTILLGMSPLLEVRGAIPIAVGLFQMPLEEAYALGVLGNLIPIVPLLLFWHYFSAYLMHRVYWINRLLSRLFSYTRRRHEERFSYHHHIHPRVWLEFFALFMFVAIPLPFTGMWSGTVASFVFGMPIRRAAPAIALGVFASGLITALVVRGIIALPF